jgi:ABC-type uncharacterized transport system involved in gliding motility auxiliary subunit
MGDQQEPVEFASEEELTGALVRLMNPEQRSVYFLTGHGEASLDDSGDGSLSLAKRVLESKNYTVSSLNLLAENKVPQDAKVIVVAGPRKPVSSAEVDLLKQYVEAGGALIVMSEPLPLTEFGDQADPLADYLAGTWGITLGKDLVIDQTSNQATVAIGSQWGQHQITTKLLNYVSVMPTSRSVTVAAGPSSVSQSELVSTSANAWGETDLVALQSQNAQVAPDEGVDIMGPVPLAAVGENFTTKARLAVFGDSDYATNGFFAAYANGDLFVNSVDWAAGQENLISLTPKDTTQRMMVPPQSAAMNLIMLGTVIVLPGLALLGGILVFIQRRRRT